MLAPAGIVGNYSMNSYHDALVQGCVTFSSYATVHEQQSCMIASYAAHLSATLLDNV